MAEKTQKKAVAPKEKPAAAKEEEGKTETAVKVADLVKVIEGLSVIELSDLVKALQEKFGVSAAATATPTAAPAVAPGPAAGTVSEQTTFNIVLSEAGPNKISVIKAVRELVPSLGLKEAKDLVEAAPKDVLTGVGKDKAEEAKKKLEGVGAKVELK